MKNEEFHKLIKEMAKCHKCLDLGDKSLINFYYDENLAGNIPSIWTDWFNRLDSKIFIIGQDWGPFVDMQEIHERFVKGEDWYTLISGENSLTKKNLEKFLKSININLNEVFVTNAIMCARMGSSYRGNNIDLKYSSKCCAKFLQRQIEIVKPKVIITLGYYPLLACSKIFNFEVEKNLTETIAKSSIINLGDCVLIPAYHPAAQVKMERQLEQYKKIKENL